ncbi:gamma-aminobutyric acid type B receptor subunit 2 [Nephila pilipes]|uniref:Gamma-aminobutyric acid type B receptor subunit 2 n=1 Tax=Nephila pilipes TaxID=299642 RepID=A0A8X6MNL1_NEPPI|nr:gamma-aminobutyric acid type B receptor subunit 2 [Nephila pilipes]
MPPEVHNMWGVAGRFKDESDTRWRCKESLSHSSCCSQRRENSFEVLRVLLDVVNSGKGGWVKSLTATLLLRATKKVTLDPNRNLILKCAEHNFEKFKLPFKRGDYLYCGSFKKLLKSTSLRTHPYFILTKFIGEGLLEDLELLKDKIINLNFINRKLANISLGKHILTHQPESQTGYSNKMYSPVLRMILNKATAAYEKKNKSFKHNIFHFNNRNSEKFDFICIQDVPNLHLASSESYFCQTTFNSQSFEKYEDSILKYIMVSKKNEPQNIIRTLEYVFYIHKNSDIKNSIFPSRDGSTLTNDREIQLDSAKNSKSDINLNNNKIYQWIGRSNPSSNILARPEKQVHCSNYKAKCLHQTYHAHHKPDKNNTVLSSEYFHKTVKRAIENKNLTIEDEAAFVANNTVTEEITTIETMTIDNVTTEIVTVDNVTIDLESIENVTIDIVTADNMTFENITTEIDTKKIIYIHGLFEMSRGECRDFPETGHYEYKAAQLAIRHINDRNLIDGYRLQMYHNDTLCDSGVAVDAFFHSLYRQPVMTTILGTGSSEVTERLARVVSRWNIVQISYGATSPALSDRKNFPMFFRTVAPDSSHNAALLSFVLYHKWFTVATLHEQGDKHSLPMTKLNTDLEQVNVTVAFTKGVSERDYKDQLQEIKNQDCRIIICSFSYSLFKKIFCEVYGLGMYGADYAWIVLGDTYESQREDYSEAECNDHQLMNAMQGVISVGSLYEVVGNETPVSEKILPEILDEIEFQTDSRSSGFVAQTYDAVWAIGLALKETEEYWKLTNSSLTLGDFAYDNSFMAKYIARTVSKLRFMGVSGPVSFHNSDRVGITAFHQIQGRDQRLVSIYTHDTAKLEFQCSVCTDIEWPGGSPPISSRSIIMRIAILDRRVFICVTALAILGVSLALTFLSFNLYYRKIKFIKLSSPNLNNFVIVGCILVYITVILLGMDHGTLFSDDHFRIVCSARAFLLSGGFSLAFGCMFIKTYRVYHIFIRANTGIVKSKLLHDQQLLGMVSVLLLIDCILVILWVTIDPMERKLISLSMQVNKDERNVVYLNLREHCSSSHMAKWLGSLYIYKGFLLVVGCYMAWETRHVKVPALNDSQYIGMSVYNVVITSVIVVALANVIPAERYTLTYVLVSTLIFVSTTMTLCILFVPKIHAILINPDDAAVVATPGVKVECKTRRFAIDEPRESLYRAEVLNRALKRELKELDEEYNKLAVKIGLTPNPIRRAAEDDENQDDESDDGLPPWISEYKDYSSNGSDEVWCTSRPTIASAFSAIHHVALQIPSTSRGCQKEAVCKVHYKLGHLKEIGCSPLAASLKTIAQPEEIPLICSKPVRNFLSDRALNELRTSQSQLKSAAILLRHPLEKQLRSEPKLFFETFRKGDFNLPIYSAKSLNQVSHVDSSQSDFSKYTTSNWETAPLNESTSFSTPLEDFMSSSNNGASSTKSGIKSQENNVTSNYISCEDISMSTQESSDFQSSHRCGNPSQLPYPVTTTICQSSSSKSYISALSSSTSSICGATISDFSSNSNDEGKKESGIPVTDVDTPLDEYSFNPEKQRGCRSSEICLSSTQSEKGVDDYGKKEESTSDSFQSNPSNFADEASLNSENVSIRSCTNRNGMLQPTVADTSSNSQSSVHSDGNSLSSENNNLTEHPAAAENLEQLRHEIFRLKRELILSQLDQSDSVDL